MASGKQEAGSWWDSIKGFLTEYAEFERSWGLGREDQIAALHAQRDAIAKIVAVENEKWEAAVATPDADRSLQTLERQIRMIEAKAAALNMGAAAASTCVMREQLRQDIEQQNFCVLSRGAAEAGRSDYEVRGGAEKPRGRSGAEAPTADIGQPGADDRECRQRART